MVSSENKSFPHVQTFPNLLKRKKGGGTFVVYKKWTNQVEQIIFEKEITLQAIHTNNINT